METKAGKIRVNIRQMCRWKVNGDNVRFYNQLSLNQGDLFVLDARPYLDCLNDFGIFYTFTGGA